MGITGTDVAKETADMVLTDDNYVSIVDAVEQGRVIYSNIRKFVYYLLSCNVAEILIIFLGTLITKNSPLTAIQLLWLNLVTDGAPALALGTEKGDPDIMSQPPRPPKEPIINRFMQVGILTQTIAITSVILAAYFIGLKWFPYHIEPDGRDDGFCHPFSFRIVPGLHLPLGALSPSQDRRLQEPQYEPGLPVFHGAAAGGGLYPRIEQRFQYRAARLAAMGNRPAIAADPFGGGRIVKCFVSKEII